MAYTSYSQALPDTSRYTLDPVLQERLSPQIRQDPYQAGLWSAKAAEYYADPFGYTNRQFGNLDEVLKKEEPVASGRGMLNPNNLDGGPSDGYQAGDQGNVTDSGNLSSFLDTPLGAVLGKVVNTLAPGTTQGKAPEVNLNTPYNPNPQPLKGPAPVVSSQQHESPFASDPSASPESLGTPSGGGPDGGSSVGVTHICTASYNVALITPTHFKSLKHYGVGLRKRDPYLMRAYDAFGPKLASYVGKSSVADKAASFLTAYYKAVQTKDSLSVTQKVFSYASDYILRPAYRIIGWVLVNFVDKK